MSKKEEEEAEAKIINPVLVGVGKKILPHQTPVYQWMIDREGEKGRNLMR